MNALPLTPLFWAVLATGVLGFAGLWWFTLGARRLARSRRLARQRARLDARSTPASDTALARLQASVHEAAAGRRDRREPAARGRRPGDPLYALPWLLVLGGAAAEVDALLDAAGDAARSRPPPPPPDAPAFWRWHLLPRMTAIETASTLVDEDGGGPIERLWHHALSELVEARGRLPLNGLVVCIGAGQLLEDGASLEAHAERLRRRVDEAATLLGVRMPLYLLVTGLQRLNGGAAVRAALPPAVLAQALGHRFALPPDLGPGAAATLDAIFEPLLLRLHALRMGLLRQAGPDARARHAVFAFVDQVASMQPGLRVVAARLLDRPGPMAPLWRGLYLTAAASSGAPGAFVADLFEHLLPADQPLAR